MSSEMSKKSNAEQSTQETQLTMFTLRAVMPCGRPQGAPPRNDAMWGLTSKSMWCMHHYSSVNDRKWALVRPWRCCLLPMSAIGQATGAGNMLGVAARDKPKDPLEGACECLFLVASLQGKCLLLPSRVPSLPTPHRLIWHP